VGKNSTRHQDRLESSLAVENMGVVVATKLKLNSKHDLAAKMPTSTPKRAMAEGQVTFCN